MEELLAEDGRLVNLIHRLPIAELSDRLLPLQKNWQDSLLDGLSLRTELPYKSLLDFLKEQEELQDTFQTLEQIPAPIITIAIPTQGGDADFVAVAAATSWANEALHRTEITIEHLSSHLGASFGLGTTGGLGTSTGIGTTTGVGATAGAGAGAAIAAVAGAQVPGLVLTWELVALSHWVAAQRWGYPSHWMIL